MTRFRLFSTDIAPTLTPDTASPGTLIVWDHDPIHGTVELTPPAGRGAVIRTGGGVVYHDLGVGEGDGTLRVAGNVDDGEWLSQATVDALKASYLDVGTEYFFTDGLNCWGVRWSRNPAGLHCWRHQLWAEAGRVEYSYEILFLIVWTAI